jgi:hypothetical protein
MNRATLRTVTDWAAERAAQNFDPGILHLAPNGRAEICNLRWKTAVWATTGHADDGWHVEHPKYPPEVWTVDVYDPYVAMSIVFGICHLFGPSTYEHWDTDKMMRLIRPIIQQWKESQPAACYGPFQPPRDDRSQTRIN